jgi:hypothetical protein
MLLKNKIYIHEIREQFLQKIIDEWEEKWQGNFEEFQSFESLKSKNAFLEALLADIENYLYQKLNGESKKYLFSKDFLRRFIFEYGDKDVRIQTHSRNAVAIYLDYQDWDDFLTKNQDLETQNVQINYVNVSESFLPALRRNSLIHLPNDSESFTNFQELKPNHKIKKYIYGFLGGILILISAYFGFDWWQNRPFSEEALKDVKFEVIKTVGTYPQSVRIMYDVSTLERVKDIEVEMGVGKIVALDNFEPFFSSSNKLKDTLSQTYFYPGIYKLNLFVNKKLVKTIHHIVYSKSDQWTSWGYGVAYQKDWTTPISTVKNYTKNGVIHFDPNELLNEIKNEEDYRNSTHVLTKKFRISLDSLTFECRMKNPENEGGERCYTMGFILTDKNSNYAIANFTMIGCTDYAALVVGKTVFRRIRPHEGKNYDLDTFGVNQNEWNIFKIKLLDNQVAVFINDKLAFKNTYQLPENLAELVDARLIFKGAGSVDWVKLSNSLTRELVYETDFLEK